MSPSHPLFFVIIYLIAFSTAFLIQLRFKNTVTSSRYETIDGLRGLLALGVLIHHSAIWFRFLKTGKWSSVSSNLYNQFGGTCVLFFFMITGFLFISKLLQVRDEGINWNHFFISRIFRLFPMYYLSIAIVVITVLVMSNWQLHVGFVQLLNQLSHWIFFTFDTMPDLNNIRKTFIVNAGVTWSLSYEWFFYFVLPILSLFVFKKHQKPWYLFICIALVVCYFYVRGSQESDIFCLAFLSGAIPAFLIRYTNFAEKAKGCIESLIGSLIVIVCLVGIVQYNHVNIYTILYSTVIFTLIAIGNSMFGLLRLSFVKFLGDISYSIYLLHGIVLFYAFHFLIGMETVRKFTTIQYSFVTFAIVPLLVCICFLTYNYIEKPLMNYGKKLVSRPTKNEL